MANEGNGELAADDQTEASSSSSKRGANKTPGGPARSKVRAGEGQVGQTLRTVYQQTVNEDVPAEMLDLLGKLA